MGSKKWEHPNSYEHGREISNFEIVGDTLFSASYSEDRSSQIINMWILKQKNL